LVHGLWIVEREFHDVWYGYIDGKLQEGFSSTSTCCGSTAASEDAEAVEEQSYEKTITIMPQIWDRSV
jgi:hypothetical protein